MSPGDICLQLDVGNSSAKWRVVTGDEVLARGVLYPGAETAKELLLTSFPTIDHIWVSSVAAPEREAELAATLQQRWGVEPWFARTQARTGDLRNSYQEPGRMGVDRWLAMLGARERVGGRLCVIDAGSALTIDIVSASGQHEGGYIIPGAALMERALLLDTDLVRFDEDMDHALVPGTSTAAAVRHGSALAQAGAVMLALDQAGDEPLTLVYSGGAGEALMQWVGRPGQWAPELVFEGLATMAARR